MSFVQDSVVPFQRLRISPACGQVSSIIISLCCPKNLTIVLLRSVRFWQKGCSSCIGSNSVRLRYCALSPIFLLCFPSSLALHHTFFFVHPFHAGIQCSCCRFQVLDGQMLRRSTNVFCSVWSCLMRHGRLHIRQNWCVLGFQSVSCVPVAQNSSRVEAHAATVCLSPLFALPTSQRTGARDPDQCGNRGLLKILSTAGAALSPGTTYTRSTPLTPAIPTGSKARVLVSTVSSWPKRNVMAFA